MIINAKAKREGHVSFNQWLYSIEGSDYQETITDAVTDLAAECAIGRHWSQEVLQLKQEFPHLTPQLEVGQPLDDMLYLVFDEGWGAPFEEAFDLYYRLLRKRLNTPQAELVEIARVTWQRGQHKAGQFRQEYRHYFEQTVAKHLYNPTLAWIKGCELAGLPVADWLGWWGRSYLYDINKYYHQRLNRLARPEQALSSLHQDNPQPAPAKEQWKPARCGLRVCQVETREQAA